MFLSTAEGTERLCRMIRAMLGISEIGVFSPHSFRISPWEEMGGLARLLYSEPVYKENHVLKDVYNSLISTKDVWRGDIILRLHTILDFHAMFTALRRGKARHPEAGIFINNGQEYLERDACTAVIHWLLVAASLPDRKAWTERPAGKPREPDIYLRLTEFFRAYSLGDLEAVNTLEPKFQLCCDCIISEEIAGLPGRFLHEFTEVVRCLTSEADQHALVNAEMDKLFRYFLNQNLGDSETDSEISITRRDQQNTLKRFVHIIALEIDKEGDLEAFWTDLLECWANLVDERIGSQLGNSTEDEGTARTFDLEELRVTIQAAINRTLALPSPTSPLGSNEIDSENEGNASENDTFSSDWVFREEHPSHYYQGISKELARHLSPG
jgi:hypothetical protein